MPDQKVVTSRGKGLLWLTALRDIVHDGREAMETDTRGGWSH